MSIYQTFVFVHLLFSPLYPCRKYSSVFDTFLLWFRAPHIKGLLKGQKTYRRPVYVELIRGQSVYYSRKLTSRFVTEWEVWQECAQSEIQASVRTVMLSASFKSFSLTKQPLDLDLPFIDYEKFVSDCCSESFFLSKQSNWLMLYLQRIFDADSSSLSRIYFSEISFVTQVSAFVLAIVFLLAEIVR